MRVAGSRGSAGSAPAGRRTSPLAWLPPLVIGVGLAFGVVLWAKWGFLVAFETLRSYCF